MSNEKILEKAIEKAIDSGWDILSRSEADGYIIRKDVYNSLFIAWANDGEQDDAFAQSFMEVIFNHDFAKALWGKDSLDHWVERHNQEFKYAQLHPLECWQHHLQQMVIADDPIKYLGENLDS